MKNLLSRLIGRNKTPAEERPKEKRPVYIYKPFETAPSYRVEYRDGVGYVYQGWSRGYVYRLVDDRLYRSGEEDASYIIIGNKVCEPSGEKLLYRIAGDSIYRGSEKEACLVIKNSITVQGTL